MTDERDPPEPPSAEEHDLGEPRRKRRKAASSPPAPTEKELASEFAERHAPRWRYVAMWRRWLLWDDVVWGLDQLLAIEFEAQEMCVELSEGLSLRDKARLQSHRTAGAIVKMASANPALAALPDDWDTNAYALSCKGELVDLKTGCSRATIAGDYVTKTCAVQPGDDCPKWLDFLELVCGGDTELMEFLQRLAGYCLTGSTKEQKLFFTWGPGGNGKSTFINTIAGIMGDYAVNAPMDMLTAGASDHHPADLAKLQGARLVTAVETDEGQRWDETRLKMLTGGDMISARFMRENFFDFKPAFKLVVSGNHKPELRGIDDALKRRVLIVPFVVRIPEEQRVLDFEQQLKAEWPGILAWMMRGVGYWREDGLRVPASVIEATGEYFEAEDVVGMWLDECTEIDVDRFESSSAYFQSWREFAKRNGETVGSVKRLTAKLRKRQDIRHDRTNKAKGFVGRRIIIRTEGEFFAQNP